ncbi:hypothetical protein C475_19638 [Halosimplex carlsbadense 2-9-1]|uniref:Uncharacterized protein n=1 Tax=Halosimplex carlsbadense 2-9-1 TaxID=797114 RepID=M0CC80_9EURY|nr:hypothetical protein C475_19638 [Halosimplex carlsbadense 2-9-1]
MIIRGDRSTDLDVHHPSTYAALLYLFESCPKRSFTFLCFQCCFDELTVILDIVAQEILSVSKKFLEIPSPFLYKEGCFTFSLPRIKVSRVVVFDVDIF